jgi:hypothetical protein
MTNDRTDAEFDELFDSYSPIRSPWDDIANRVEQLERTTERELHSTGLTVIELQESARRIEDEIKAMRSSMERSFAGLRNAAWIVGFLVLLGYFFH